MSHNELATLQPVGEMPMKWYKFIIYCQLFFSAISCLANGYYMTIGYQYGEYVSQIYTYFPGMQILDIITACFYFALAVYVIIVRHKLAKFQKSGPSLYISIYAISALAALLYTLIATLIIHSNVFSATVIGRIIANVIWLLINKKYFERRRHLFINDNMCLINSFSKRRCAKDTDSESSNCASPQTPTASSLHTPAQYCHKCGNKLEPDSRFCSKCGAKTGGLE